MRIEDYFSERDGRISFTRRQGSDFAKRIADDFNPLHDVDARRFCIPGDLLFAIVLARYGLSEQMAFTFSGMVTEGIELVLPEPAGEMRILDAQGREYLRVSRSGSFTRDADLIGELTRSYVAFSGHTFPHILVPLLAEQQVMINPERPMVIYESMTLALERLDIAQPLLRGTGNRLALDGKRGSVELMFDLFDGDAVVGRGRKNMLLSGLRAHDPEVIATSIAMYNDIKQAFAAS